MELARKLGDIQPFYAMNLLAKAKVMEGAGRDIIHMEIGEPDFDTPEPVRDAGIAAIQAGHTHYTAATGLPALREAIAAFYRARYQVHIHPDEVLITPGASGALQLVLGALLNPGDEVLMTDPGYPCNRHFVRLFEGCAKPIAVDASTQFQLTAELVEQHWTSSTRILLLASPANPTGTLVHKSELRAIVKFVHARGGIIIVDEIYQGLIYSDGGYCAREIDDQIILVNSFSKYFGMTGWRLGWLVAPASLIEGMDRLAQNIFLAPSTPAQYAALAAFHPETLTILEARRKEYQQRRDFLYPALQKIGFACASLPEGAFYLYADCSRLAQDSFALCEDLLEKVGVAITPGKDFGLHRPQDFVRFAYTTNLERLEEGVARMQRYFRQ